MTVPTLDLSVFRETHSEGEFVESLRSCCHEGCGFFYLTGHTVPLELIESVEKVMKRAFQLPEHTKATIDKAHSPQFRGWCASYLHATVTPLTTGLDAGLSSNRAWQGARGEGAYYGEA